MWVPELLLPPKIIRMFGPKTAIFAPKYAFLGTYRPCRLIWCPVGWLVGGVLFRAGVLLSIKNAKCWHILTSLGYFVANLSTFWWCTLVYFGIFLTNVAEYQNGQISGRLKHNCNHTHHHYRNHTTLSQ